MSSYPPMCICYETTGSLHAHQQWHGERQDSQTCWSLDEEALYMVSVEHADAFTIEAIYVVAARRIAGRLTVAMARKVGNSTIHIAAASV